jgi:DNA-binding NtrC family response regulator
MLLGLACDVAGPAATVKDAMHLVHTESFDAVLLDVDLAGEEAWPIADELLDLHKPFILITGFACPSSLPREFRDAPYLEKPFDQRELGEKLLQVLKQ